MSRKNRGAVDVCGHVVYPNELLVLRCLATFAEPVSVPTLADKLATIGHPYHDAMLHQFLGKFTPKTLVVRTVVMVGNLRKVHFEVPTAVKEVLLNVRQ